MDPGDSLIKENEDLNTNPEKESYEFIKSSVEDHVPIPSESKDTSNSECDLPFCGNSITFSNLLFDSKGDFTSSDDESLFDEDVPEDNVLGDIENKDSYVSNLDEPDLLVTHLSNANEDECFDPGDDVDEIELLLHRDPSTPKMSVASILEGFTNEPPLEENDDLFNLESKENEWKKILYDAPIDDLMTEDKIFDPEIHEKFFLQHMISPDYEDSRDYALKLVWGGSLTLRTMFSSSMGEIPYGEIKVHIKVLSVLWGNRLSIPDGSLPLSRIGRGGDLRAMMMDLEFVANEGPRLKHKDAPPPT
uniref:Reverse transcriptase domain-containing protein n=1 Tax=Tanacetum cinerariifolium TaxID=118510 RepID=A0A699HBA2_TANCI|nr:hypothetical protein [Tanacetum cinerariifolium]